MPGDFQVFNAGGVLTLLEAAGFVHLLDKERVDGALANLGLAGRMQAWRDSHRWLFDVAHNPAAARAMAEILGSERHHRRVCILGMLDNKDTEGVVRALARSVDEWIAVTAESERAVPASELGRRAAGTLNRHCLIADGIDDAIRHARRLAGPDDEILVLGSFTTVGPVQEALGL